MVLPISTSKAAEIIGMNHYPQQKEKYIILKAKDCFVYYYIT
jgi:hypothetical protein